MSTKVTTGHFVNVRSGRMLFQYDVIIPDIKSLPLYSYLMQTDEFSRILYIDEIFYYTETGTDVAWSNAPQTVAI